MKKNWQDTKTRLASRSMTTMRPELRPWQDGQAMKMGKWSMRDGEQSDGIKTRYIYHYDTLMGYFSSEYDDQWAFFPVSTGHGGASDGRGMNNLLTIRYSWEMQGMLHDYGWYFRQQNQSSVPVAMYVSNTGDVFQ